MEYLKRGLELSLPLSTLFPIYLFLSLIRMQQSQTLVRIISVYVICICILLPSIFYAPTFASTYSVTSIYIVLFKLKIRVNVNGKGTIKIKYCDPWLRVLESEEGATVLQEKVELPVAYSRYIC